MSCLNEIALSSCSCVYPTLALTEMLVYVLNSHSEDDNDEPTEAGGEGVRWGECEGWMGMRVNCEVTVRYGENK